MLALESGHGWLSGRWLPPASSVPGTSMVDIYGTTISVGSLVKLVGKVTAVDALNSHFANVTIQSTLPQDNSVPAVTVQAHPLQLVVVGSSL